MIRRIAWKTILGEGATKLNLTILCPEHRNYESSNGN